MASAHPGVAENAVSKKRSHLFALNFHAEPKRVSPPLPSEALLSRSTWLQSLSWSLHLSSGSWPGFRQKPMISDIISDDLIQGSLSTRRLNENLGNQHGKHNNFPSVIEGNTGEHPHLSCAEECRKTNGLCSVCYCAKSSQGRQRQIHAYLRLISRSTMATQSFVIPCLLLHVEVDPYVPVLDSAN